MSDYEGQDIFHATITVLPDNQQPSAMNFALATEGLTDRTTFLHNRGFAGIYTQTSSLTSGDGGTVYGAVGGSGTFVEFDATNGLVPYVDVPGCQVGDVVVAWATGHFISQGNAPAGYAEIKLYRQFDVGGSPPAAAAMSGAHAMVAAVVSTAHDIPEPILIMGWAIVSTAGTCRVRLRGKNPSAVGAMDQEDYKTGIARRNNGEYVLSITAMRLRPTVNWNAD